MDGTQLKTKRLEFGLSRRVLADICKLHPNSIAYWERQAQIDPRGYACSRILEVLGLTILRRQTRAREHGVLQSQGLSPCSISKAQTRVCQSFKGRNYCEAQTRKGTPCQRVTEPGKTRCRLHGGLSTGPKTAEGKAKIAEAQKKRWATVKKRNIDIII